MELTERPSFVPSKKWSTLKQGVNTVAAMNQTAVRKNAKKHSNLYNQKPVRIFKITRLISNAEFPIHLVFSEENYSYHAMKSYSLNDHSINHAYQRESQLIDLKHPHIIRVFDVKCKKEPDTYDKEIPLCYMLMELAPYGSFLDLISNKKFTGDEILARTYFHQLIDAIEYMHSKGIAHSNICLENLLIGEDYQLKLVGFSNLNSEKSGFRYSGGTKNFRAWEVKTGKGFNPKAADIYSAAIFLFVMKSEGMMPYVEERNIRGVDLFEVLKRGYEPFWDAYHECQNRVFHCDESFMKLFISMVKFNPSDRVSIEKIRANKWYQGEVYDKHDLIKLMKEKYRLPSLLQKKSNCREDDTL